MGSLQGRPSPERAQQFRPSEGAVLGGRYRLESPIEKGSTGEVWRGRRLSIGKRVAIKVLRAEHAADKDDWATKRMLREAQLLSEIDHPAVVDVLDFGKEQGCPYIVMELLEGRTLATALRDGGAMPWGVAGPLLQQMIDGLAAAHQAGVVHRDLKPANIILQRGDTRAKIVDFGIASASKRPRITLEGEVLGTPHFMSPEQSRTMNLGASSDIYSLGCVAFAILVGRPPYVGNIGEIVRQHLKASVPKVAELVGGDVPDQVCRAVERSMAKQPEQRFQTMEALHEEMFDRELGEGTQATGRMRVRAQRSQRGLATALVAGAAIAGGLAVAATSVWQTDSLHLLSPAVSALRRRAVASPAPAANEAELPKPIVEARSTIVDEPPEPSLPVEVAKPKARPGPKKPAAAIQTPPRKRSARAARRSDTAAEMPAKPEAAAEVATTPAPTPNYKAGDLKNPFDVKWASPKKVDTGFMPRDRR